MINKIYCKRVISLFIIIQPLLDVLTYFSNAKLGFSVGMICRGAFLLYAIVYFLIFGKNKKINMCFMLTIFAFVLVYFFVNCNSISIFMYRLPGLFKFLYFPILTLFLYETYNIKLKNKFLIAITSICLYMILAQIFGDVVLSYESSKLGNSGWFFSSNEFSGICSILFPLVYAYFIENLNRFGLIITILLTICMLLIGTKTAYLAIALTLIMFTGYFILRIIVKHEKSTRLKISLALLVLFILITPITYTYKNLYIQNSKNVNDIILNGRDKIKEKNVNSILDCNISDIEKGTKCEDGKNNKFNPLVGVIFSHKANYEFERDFYNIYYNYGIIGLIIYFMIPAYILIKKFLQIRDKKYQLLNCTKYGAAVSLFISIGISYLVGHTLLAPAVCIYISLVLLVFISNTKASEKKKVMFISSVGGHLTQLLELKSIFDDYEYILVTEKTDVTINMKNKFKIQFLAYGSRKYIFKYAFIAASNMIKSVYLFSLYMPDVIVTTGTHTAVPMCYIGWLFNKKVIYIESFAKRTSPTLTGRIVYPISSVFIVQWESMLKYYPKAQYWGGIY